MTQSNNKRIRAARSVDELARLTAEFDRESVTDAFHTLSPASRQWWANVNQKPGRPRKGQGSLGRTSRNWITRTTTEATMNMHNPPHPGEVLKALCLEPLKLTVTAAAMALGVSRKTLSAILTGRAGISPKRAVRLSIAFDTTAAS